MTCVHRLLKNSLFTGFPVQEAINQNDAFYWFNLKISPVYIPVTQRCSEHIVRLFHKMMYFPALASHKTDNTKRQRSGYEDPSAFVSKTHRE